MYRKEKRKCVKHVPQLRCRFHIASLYTMKLFFFSTETKKSAYRGFFLN
jgi:hypothetical protein